MKKYLSNFILFLSIIILIISCTTTKSSNYDELENKGTVMGVSTPNWVKLYTASGVSALQKLPEYKDKYCIVGEESGVNRQFVINWADAASAQQRIGSLLRTNIASRYSAAITGSAQSSTESTAVYQQEIDNVLNAIVNVSYSGAQRDADWWSLRRRYEPGNKEIYTDEFTAWVLYTIPKAEMNRQIAFALENSTSKDSALYDVTIAIARDILLQGYDTSELQNAAAIQNTASANYDPKGSVTSQAMEEINHIDEYAIGREVTASFLANNRIYDANPALTDYLNKILSALVINSPKPVAYNGYRAAIIDSDNINAFASPAGHIFLTRGLINAAKSEDALAAALAHELAHIQLRHGIRAIQSNRNTEEWTNQFLFGGAQIIADKINNGYSQTQEFDADITALSLLAAAKYNPQGLIDMLSELEKVQSTKHGGFNSTHPSPTSRLVNAKVAAARYANLTDNRRVRQNRFERVVK
ncbi:MAG: M48 family metalloprotease [Treponema sp.]|nr:M48 family metalloprotease [Treponema sp.]MCL2252372.1 M48 family metalloprotease [Treponema sp.]